MVSLSLKKKVKISLKYQTKHVKSMGTISEILITINLFSLGIYRIPVLFGNAELVSVVKGGDKARTVRRLKSQHSVRTCLGRPGIRSGNAPALLSWGFCFPRPQFPHLP